MGSLRFVPALGVGLSLVALTHMPTDTHAGLVLLSQERFIHNPMAASDGALVPVKSASAFEDFNESINIEQVFDGNFDPATGMDSTITSITRIEESSSFFRSGSAATGFEASGFARAFYHNTHSVGPSESPNHDVDSTVDVTFRLTGAERFTVAVRSDTTGDGAEFLLSLDGPDGSVIRLEGDVDEPPGSAHVIRGVLAAGDYHFRQTARAATLNDDTSANWAFSFGLDDPPSSVPLPPAAWQGLFATGTLFAGGAVLRLRRRGRVIR